MTCRGERIGQPQVDRNEVQAELLVKEEHHLMQLYCSRQLNNVCEFYRRSMRLCYANFPFSKPKRAWKERGWNYVPLIDIWQGNTPIEHGSWTV